MNEKNIPVRFVIGALIAIGVYSWVDPADAAIPKMNIDGEKAQVVYSILTVVLTIVFPKMSHVLDKINRIADAIGIRDDEGKVDKVAFDNLIDDGRDLFEILGMLKKAKASGKSETQIEAMRSLAAAEFDRVLDSAETEGGSE